MEELIIVIVCLFLNAVFAAIEMAFVSAPRSELRALSRKGSLNAKTILKLREHPERTLSVIQIGITLVGAVAAAVGGAGAAESLEPYIISRFGLSEFSAEMCAIIAVVIPISYFSVVVGELVPKSLALRNASAMTLRAARSLVFMDKALSPVVSVLEWSTKQLLRIFPKPVRPEATAPTSIEIDALSPSHQKIVLNVAGIEQKKVRDMMVAWEQVTAVRDDSSLEEIALTIFQSGHTRLPVVSGGHVIGVLHAKEFMAFRESGEQNWHSIVRSPITVHPQSSALGTLRLMQEKRSHMSIVVGTAQDTAPKGILTLEDILEEFVGEINDEDDDGKIQKIYIAKARARNMNLGEK